MPAVKKQKYPEQDHPPHLRSNSDDMRHNYDLHCQIFFQMTPWAPDNFNQNKKKPFSVPLSSSHSMQIVIMALKFQEMQLALQNLDLQNLMSKLKWEKSQLADS